MASEYVEDELASTSPGLRDHDAAPSPSRSRGNAATNSSTCATVMINGGANRSASGVGALMMKPAVSARSATMADTSADRTMARRSHATRTPEING